MSDLAELLERESRTVDLKPGGFERLTRKRDRKQRNRRIGSAVVALLVVGATVGGLLRALSSDTNVASPVGPFLGRWVATDLDGSLEHMTIRAPGDEGATIVVRDDSAGVCSGTPSTMTGTGGVVGTDLVIPSPALTCDDGSEPQTESGPPLAEQVRNLTFVHHAQPETLTDTLGLTWERDHGQDPGGEQASGGMWPQSSPEQVREAQRLADAGDPRATWQLDPKMLELGGPRWFVADGTSYVDAEIVARFIRQKLGWEEFRFNEYEGWDETFGNLTYVRCATGGANALYPDDPYGGGCAPTIDDLRYETVQLDLAQPGRQGPSGIWVVSGWETIAPFSQVVPPTDAEAAAVLQPFLQARIAGEGAEAFLADGGNPPPAEVAPIMYATTAGAPYERSEFERVDGPRWPFGDMALYKVRLFADGGQTVVEQLFSLNHEAGGLRLKYSPSARDGIAPTTENGQPVVVPYRFQHGEVTYTAAPPWGVPWTNIEGLLLDGEQDERLELVADPLPVETGCRRGPAPADARALARSIRSDPDFQVTAPVAVNVGGIDALRMDVVAAPGASVCKYFPAPIVLTGDDLAVPGVALEQGHRMRLYLLDLPEGMSAQIMAIAIVAPEARFDQVIEAANPVVDSFEFHTR